MRFTLVKVSKAMGVFFTNRLYFCAAYLIILALRSIPTIMAFVNPLIKLGFVWGIGLLLWDLFTKRSMFRGYKSILLVLFMFSYGITILLNPASLYDGVKYFIYNGILFFLFYPGDVDIPMERKARVLIVTNDIFTVLCFVTSCISIVMFLLGVSYSIQVDSVVYGQGVLYNRLYGIYISANPGALASVCTVFLTLITYHLNKEHFHKFRIFYVINIVIQFIFFTLTLSNGGHLAWIIALMTFAACIVLPWLRKRFKVFLSLLLTTIIFAAVFVAFESAVSASRKFSVWLASGIQMNISSANSENADDSQGEQPNGGVILERVEDGTDLSNGRLTIWDAALAAWKQKPLFGWADCRFFDGDQTRIPIDVNQLSSLQIHELKRAQGYMHNALMQIVVCSGSIGLCVFLIFAVLSGVKYVRALFHFYNRPGYYVLAAIVVFIALMLSQQLAESHLLFTRHDVFSYLFWLYFGFGMQVIKHEEEKEKTDFAFVCDTPLQVLNAVSFVESNAEDCKGRSDLFLYHQFRGSEELSARLKEQGVFRNVYDVSKFRKRNGLRSKLATGWRLLFPKHVLKTLCNGNRNYAHYQYGTLVLSFYTPFSDVLRLALKTPHTIQFEDGLGSYVTDNLESHYRSAIFNFVNKTTNGALSYHPQVLYLNNPTMCTGNTLPVKKLAGMSHDNIAKTIKAVYGFRPSVYKEYQTVYLTQPFGPAEGGRRVIDAEKQMLPLLKMANPLVRVHPRQSSELFDGFTLDVVGNMWEIECAETIGDNHVLIGAFSTAQFAPKTMFDREPTLVFLYKLYGCEFNNADELVSRVREAYTQPQKVLVPETIEEFKAILEALYVEGDENGEKTAELK